MYRRFRDRGRRSRFLRGLIGRQRKLLALDEARRTFALTSPHDAGILTVPIRQIAGSEGRVRDFDRDFYPLKEHVRQRWLGIAAARLQEQPLPPVVLDQIGDVFFVRDGHHRISVAVALGQKSIEARVQVWDLAAAPPDRTQETRGGYGDAPRGLVRRLLARVHRRPAGATLRLSRVA